MVAALERSFGHCDVQTHWKKQLMEMCVRKLFVYYEGLGSLSIRLATEYAKAMITE